MPRVMLLWCFFILAIWQFFQSIRFPRLAYFSFNQNHSRMKADKPKYPLWPWLGSTTWNVSFSNVFLNESFIDLIVQSLWKRKSSPMDSAAERFTKLHLPMLLCITFIVSTHANFQDAFDIVRNSLSQKHSKAQSGNWMLSLFPILSEILLEATESSH